MTPADHIVRRIRRDARRHARLLARWQLRVEQAIILSAALWFVADFLLVAIGRVPA